MPSTQIFRVDGAVPDFGDRLSQVALLVDVQLSVPPPVLLMVTDVLEPHGRLPPYGGEQRPNVATTYDKGEIAIAGATAATVWFWETIVGLVGASEEQAAIPSVVTNAMAARLKYRRLDIHGSAGNGDVSSAANSGVTIDGGAHALLILPLAAAQLSGESSELIMPGSRVRVPPLLLTQQPLVPLGSSGLVCLTLIPAVGGIEIRSEPGPEGTQGGHDWETDYRKQRRKGMSRTEKRNGKPAVLTPPAVVEAYEAGIQLWLASGRTVGIVARRRANSHRPDTVWHNASRTRSRPLAGVTVGRLFGGVARG